MKSQATKGDAEHQKGLIGAMTACVIGQLAITEATTYQEYGDGFMPSFTRHGGELLATSGDETEVLEGQ